jgi:hypothetical protein
MLPFAFGAFAMACGSGTGGSPPHSRTLTGEVDGTDARVGVVASGNHARFYFCGGPTSYTTMTVWLPIDVDASGNVSLGAGSPSGFQVSGKLGDSSATGTFVAGGASATFHAAPVAGSSVVGGLYEAQAPCGHVGVIVADEAPPAAPVLQGACIGNTDPPSFEQVNPLGPLTRAADGTLAVTIAGSTTVTSVAAAAP